MTVEEIENLLANLRKIERPSVAVLIQIKGLEQQLAAKKK